MVPCTMLGTHGPCSLIIAASFLDRTTLLSLWASRFVALPQLSGRKRSYTILHGASTGCHARP